MERVSVVIASYNAGDFLGVAIESVLSQTYDDFHIYVIDDGSTDSTPSVLSNYTGDPRITTRRQSNLGQASAKNHGASMAKGEFIAFLDADDCWENNKLELQIPVSQKFRSYPQLICAH